MAAGTSKLAHLLDHLEKFYGTPKPPHPTDPYEMILYINSAYLATDASCAEVFDALKRSVGLRIDDILAAPKGKLTEIMKLGGIFPEQRAVRLKEIAALVKLTFAGDLRCEQCPVSSECLYYKRLQHGRSATI